MAFSVSTGDSVPISAEMGHSDTQSISSEHANGASSPPFRVLTDRSRVIEYQRCPRARWWGYEYKGRGIRPKAASIPLSTGTYVHVGLGALLEGKGVEAAVKAAVNGYMLEIERRDIQVEYLTEDRVYVAHEQKALIEALIRAYEAWQLPRLLEEYDVLEVEQEDLFGLTEEIGWQARLDGLLREKASGDLYVMSFKTAASWDRRKESEGRHDMQGLSEPRAVEVRLKQDWKIAIYPLGAANTFLIQWRGKQYVEWLASLPIPPKIQGVKMEFLIKGTRREHPQGSGRYVTYNPLIRAYRFRGITPDQDQYSWKYSSRKGWETFNVWEADDIGGVKGWVEMLKSGQVEGGEDCLAQTFVLNPPYMRLPEETERWERQTRMQEGAVSEGSGVVNAGWCGDEVDMSYLDRYFPQHTRSCDYPDACDYQSICWGSRSPEELLAEGRFIWREPHHEPEVQKIKSWREE
jgi:hypothetical protein